jgi:hypothetical protein
MKTSEEAARSAEESAEAIDIEAAFRIVDLIRGTDAGVDGEKNNA